MSELEQLVRKNILGIAPYQPGKPIEEVQRELGLQDIVKLASNENPLGSSPKAVEAIKASIGKINRYPESGCFYLKRALAKIFGLEPKNFIIGNGSDEIIVLVLRAFINPEDEVIIASPTFLIYEIQAQACGASLVKVPLKNFRYDLMKMQKVISAKTKIVFIANPDNPTGTYVTETEVCEFMETISKKTVVFFDEAYFEFAKNLSDFPNTLRFLKNKNIIITRSFSKVYGLAGLRVGYGISSPELINYLERVREPFNVNTLAEVAAVAALEDEEFLKNTLKITEEGKKFLYRELRGMGVGYLNSATNFVLIDVGDGERIFKSLLKEGVIVRDMKAWKLDNFIRVTIGTPEENERFIKALRKVLNSLKMSPRSASRIFWIITCFAVWAAMHLKREDNIAARLDTATGKIKFFLEGKEVDSTSFGRIAAQTAKQVIIQKIREAERGLIFSEFEAKKGEIVNGLVHRIEKGNLIIDLGKAEGIIFRQEQSKREEFRQGDRIKAFCLDVRKSSHGPQVILSRTHPEFVRKLFEIEVPEIYEKIVEVKFISREAGERTKIAVWSGEEKVDPVGACVGVRGSRVKNIVKELHGEKIDIIRWSSDLSEFVKAALAPAQLEEINIDSQSKKIQVIVDDDQLSLAIGKRGRNVRLACKLVGWDIDIRTKIQIAAQKKVTLRDIKGVGSKLAQVLEEAGLVDLDKIANSTVEELTKIKGIGKVSAEKIIEGAKGLLGRKNLNSFH